MQDYKKAAAGDQEPETLQQSVSSSRTSAIDEYLTSLIVWLEAFTGKRLSDRDTELWIARLRNYPMWRLDQASEYTGTLSNDFFKYLDGLRKPEEAPRALPEPKQTDRVKLGTKITLRYCRDVSLAKTHEEAVALELKYASDMFEQVGFIYKPILRARP